MQPRGYHGVRRILVNHRNHHTWQGWANPVLSLSLVVALALFHQWGFGPLLRLDHYLQDLLVRQGRKANPHPQLVFLGVDRGSYEDVLMPADYQSAPIVKELDRSFPWSRAVWAAVIDKLVAAGARVVALDFLFTSPGEGDDVLRETLDRHAGRVVLASAFVETHANLGSSLVYSPPADTLIPGPLQKDQVGFVNLWPDRDDVIRHAHFRIDDGPVPGGAGLESFASKVLRMAGLADRIPSAAGPMRFRYSGPRGTVYPHRPFHEVFIPKFWKQNYQDGAFFKDKIVVIAPAANLFHDELLTPFESPEPLMYGAELHLQILSAALQGEFIRQSDPGLDWGWILAAGIVMLAAIQRVSGARSRLIIIIVGIAAYGCAAQLLFDRANLLVPTAAPILSMGIVGVVVLGHDFTRERLERLRIRRTLERYVSKDIVREIVDNRSSYFHSLEGVRKPVTILFSDVRGFTSLTEGADSRQLVQQLNEYFERMVAIVFERQGTLDKFIGDAVMAHWGSIVSHGPGVDAVRAVEAALAMQHSLSKLNQEWKARGWPELSIGIGINHAEVIVGNLGSQSKMELTVIGDGVNLASRLEGLTKAYGLGLILGGAAARLVADRFPLRTVDRVRVKGRTRPVTVHTVVSLDSATATVPAWLQAYEDGVQAYQRREFQAALSAFERSEAGNPGDVLTTAYIARTHDLLQSPPGDEWDGITEMAQK
jgi:adenylate cyclase